MRVPRCGPGRRRRSLPPTIATTARVTAASPSRQNASGAASSDTAAARTAIRPQAVASPARPRFQRISSHAVRRLDPNQVEAAGGHRLRRGAQAEPEALLGGAEHLVVVVEAVEIVRQPD